MPRKYARKLGSRKYKDFLPENLENALTKITEEGWSINKALNRYGISYGTLYNKYKGLHIKKAGGQTIFTEAEEKQIIRGAVACSELGFPLNIIDLQNITKNFLDRQGCIVPKFTNNMPGRDWVDSLLKRHKDTVTQRLAANIKRARANVSKSVLRDYFQNLEESIRDVPDTNLFNYDETNMADDPGRKRLLYKRGVKYPTNVVNFSKSATSVMFCGLAAGVLLPPNIIYKAENIWDRWTENGPKGAPCCSERCCSIGTRYNRTQSGWIDSNVFTDWFISSFLPHAVNLPGKKVLIGDNLASHFTDEVLQLCEQNNIAFVCLPPNTTHLTQPLDVCFFRPLKIAWWSILSNWKKSNPSALTIKKEDFPKLLRLTLTHMNSKSPEGAIKSDLINGFKATGIYPLHPEKVLDKLPDEKQNENPEDIEEGVNTVLLNYLKVQRYNNIPKRRQCRKKKRIEVIPGKSVSGQNSADSSFSNDDEVLYQDLSSDADNSPEAQDDEIEYREVEKGNLINGDFVLVKVKSWKTEVGCLQICSNYPGKSK